MSKQVAVAGKTAAAAAAVKNWFYMIWIGNYQRNLGIVEY